MRLYISDSIVLFLFILVIHFFLFPHRKLRDVYRSCGTGRRPAQFLRKRSFPPSSAFLAYSVQNTHTEVTKITEPTNVRNEIRRFCFLFLFTLSFVFFLLLTFFFVPFTWVPERIRTGRFVTQAIFDNEAKLFDSFLDFFLFLVMKFLNGQLIIGLYGDSECHDVT